MDELKRLKEEHLRLDEDDPRFEELTDTITRRIFQDKNQEWLEKRELVIDHGGDPKIFLEE